MFRRKRQFDELIERQLDIFATEHADDLKEIAEARARWRRSDVADSRTVGTDWSPAVLEGWEPPAH